jgi:hypothetical protein
MKRKRMPSRAFVSRSMSLKTSCSLCRPPPSSRSKRCASMPKLSFWSVLPEKNFV